MNNRGAILYVRVSTAEQANGALNLSNQEQRCREFCAQRGLKPLQIFIDRGESARTADRPEFKKMLAYCRKHKRDVSHVVVQELSRFARNIADQANFMAELQMLGVELCSVNEPNIDNTPQGKLCAGLFGTFNQYFSDALSQKMRERSRAAVEAGRWPWAAPLGYLNVDNKQGANIAPDPQRAPLIRRAFEMVATGSYKLTEVLRTLTREGLTAKNGGPVYAQTFHKMLQQPVYAGWIKSRKSGLTFKGLHLPIIEQALFDTVQRVLRGEKPSIAPQRKAINPDFPLKQLVRCAACNRPLTGGFSRGKSGKLHPYYRCYVCGQVKNVRKDYLEGLFVELLQRLRPSPEDLAALPLIAAEVWAEQQGDAAKQAKRITGNLEKLQGEKSRLVRSMAGEQDPDLKGAYGEEFRKISSEIADLEANLQNIALSRDEMGEFVRFVQECLLDVADCWQQAEAEDKLRVQTFLFSEGLRFSPESKTFELSNSNLFTVLDGLISEKINLASPGGFEPPLPP